MCGWCSGEPMSLQTEGPCFSAQSVPAARSKQGQNQVAVGVTLHDLHVFIVFGNPLPPSPRTGTSVIRVDNTRTRLLDALKAQAARGGETVPAAFVDATLRGFETHANTYDDKYAARLAAAMA